MKAGRQRVMHCPCGNAKVLALGLCATCYTLKRQDEEYFGGLREAVLERDGYRCRVCDASGRDKRSIIVHHRVPGKSVLNLMLSLCPGCHAKIHRTKAVLSAIRPSCWNCGESCTLWGMSRYNWTSTGRSLRRNRLACSASSAGSPGEKRDSSKLSADVLNWIAP